MLINATYESRTVRTDQILYIVEKTSIYIYDGKRELTLNILIRAFLVIHFIYFR